MQSYISKIRELINKLILKSLLLKDQKKWNLVCGSLDAIESAQLAVDSYNYLNKKNIKNTGLKHLLIYGLFQALYVQQDSVLNLSKSVDIPIPEGKNIKIQYPELYEIRQLRNKGIGHPTPNKKDEIKDTHSISVNEYSIELFSYTEAGQFSFATFKISDCIEEQNQSLCKIMQQVIEKMESIEQKHKDKYMQNKLRDCFPTDPQYCIGKIFEAINLIDYKGPGESLPQKVGRETRMSLALSHTNTLITAVKKFNAEFDKRCLEDDYVRIEIDHSEYPLEKLKEYFSPTSESSMNSQDSRAYADSAEKHILDLIKHATRLDIAYSS